MMEVTILSIVVSVGWISIVTWAWMVLNWLWLRPKRLEKILREQGFNGKSYRVFHGDTKDITRMLHHAKSEPMPGFSHDYVPRILPFLHLSLNTYGKKLFTWNGPTPTIYMTDPEQIREVFMKMYDFQRLNINPHVRMLAPGLVNYEGEKWARHRKLINPAFHMEKLKLMLPAFCESSNAMIRKWEKKVSENGSKIELDVWPYLHNLSADAISRAAFGSSFEDGRRIFDLIEEQILLTIPAINSVYVPGWRFVPTRKNKRIIQIDKEIKELLKGMINKRKNAMIVKDDLLGILLESISATDHLKSNKKSNSGMSLIEVVEECKLFYLAGQETTSTLLTWTLILLSKHQDWQARARQEVLATFGDRKLEFYELNNLKIVTMILHEVLRLYPPVILLRRRVPNDTIIGNTYLPAGVQVNLPMVVVHHDQDLWGKDAKEFNPERFAGGISNATGGNMSFFSFGWGPRICLGSNFAMTEAKMSLAMILQRFSLELSPAYVHGPATVATLQPQYGAQIILKRL